MVDRVEDRKEVSEESGKEKRRIIQEHYSISVP
jgi:hypothetical protein